MASKKKNRTDFVLIQHGHTSWYDVKYTDEDKPRYTINGSTGMCTCRGATHGLLCKHMIRFFEIVYMVDSKFDVL